MKLLCNKILVYISVKIVKRIFDKIIYFYINGSYFLFNTKLIHRNSKYNGILEIEQLKETI